jgi:spore germination cell wall hydrolase CwlJ-like protein
VHQLYEIKHTVQQRVIPVIISVPEEEGKPIEIVKEEEIKAEIKTETEPEYLTKLRSIESIENKKEWYLAYKDLEAEYPEISEIDHIYDIFSQEDIYWLQRAVETECHGAEFEGKVNVAAVVINRVLSHRYPNTFQEVVTQPNQFAYNKTLITEDTVLACEYAWAMRTKASDCFYFHSNNKTETFCGRVWKFSDDYHNFY